MAPGTRRANRSGYAEHDDFEGLPVRQWRQDWVTVAPPEQQEQQQQNDIWALELIHGMPKDATLLPLHTQELLRAARSGRLYKRPPPAEEEDAEAEAAPEKQEKKEEETVATGFSVKLWKQLPRSSEDIGLSHLAKRRKGTITIASKTVHEKVVGPTVTRATVRRIDAAGNPYTEEVTLADGQQVQGEIISTRVEAAPTGQPETFQHAPPPPARKRAPPPKRKRAGPGRGKKKVKIPLPGAVQPAGAIPDANGLVTPKPNGVPNDTKSASEAPTNHDSEMADGDENDEDEDDDDEGDEGDEGEEGEGEDTPSVQQGDSAAVDEGAHLDKEMKDAAPAVEAPESKEQMDVEMEDATSAPAPADLPKPPALASALAEASVSSPMLEGSPLKNEVLPPPESKPADEAAQAMAATDDAPTEQPQIQGEDNDQKQETEESQQEPASVADSLPEPKEVAPEAEEAPLTNALLPPPPDQVGNISSPNASPKDESAPDHSSLSADKAHDDEERGGEDLLDKPAYDHSDLMSVDDPIKPEDSVSMGVPRTESGAPSEAATGSVGATTETELKVENPSAQSPEKLLEQPAEQSSEQALEQLPEQSSEQALEQLPEQSSEQALEQLPDQPSEQIAEQIADQSLEEPSAQSTTEAPEEILEQLPDQPSEEPQPESDVPKEAPAEETPQISEPAQEESDLLDGLMGELDREASKTAAAGAESAGPDSAEAVPEPGPAAGLSEDTALKSPTPDKELKKEPESETKVEAAEEPLSEVKEEVKEEPKDVSPEAPMEETAATEAQTSAPADPVAEN
ncbi:unnamed protein product [Clonostachys rosea]|uniref:Apopolysialoglycoprotein n=1 Tax=Bionectria ochroleuca TaxID=29856 RepID=A0ABY6TT68_BIOOC|nr:unnamed protein product [Clonostachys rosea]